MKEGMKLLESSDYKYAYFISSILKLSSEHILLNKSGLTCKSHCLIFLMRYISVLYKKLHSQQRKENKVVPENKNITLYFLIIGDFKY